MVCIWMNFQGEKIGTIMVLCLKIKSILVIFVSHIVKDFPKSVHTKASEIAYDILEYFNNKLRKKVSIFIHIFCRK